MRIDIEDSDHVRGAIQIVRRIEDSCCEMDNFLDLDHQEDTWYGVIEGEEEAEAISVADAYGVMKVHYRRGKSSC